MTDLTYTPKGTKGFSVDLTTKLGNSWTLAGDIDQQAPDEDALTAPPNMHNANLHGLMWNFAVNELHRRRSRFPKERKDFEKRAKQAEKDAIALATLCERPNKRSVLGWCSGCHEHRRHFETRTKSLMRTYLCGGCGVPTVICAGAKCKHLAVAPPTSPGGMTRYCAEHSHQIPSFETTRARFSSLEDFETWREFKEPNLARRRRVLTSVFGSAVVVAPIALMAAPAIGGVIGVWGGLSGAAATSHGLAVLGGGAIASGGLGMAGGTMVVTAIGAGLGGAMGASITTAYTSDDKSFAIKPVRSGSGPAIVIASGFLTEGQTGWSQWQKIIDERFPDNPVYRVSWGAKELTALWKLLGVQGGKHVALHALKALALQASKKATLPGVGVVLAAGDLVKNPWFVARQRADMTGAALADIISRVDGQDFILVGHSLGARVMSEALETLSTASRPPSIQDAHLLGAAINSDIDWTQHAKALSGTIFNYHSSNDGVLRNLFRYAQMGKVAAGLAGAKTRSRGIKNLNVSTTVKTHADYFDKVKLR